MTNNFMEVTPGAYVLTQGGYSSSSPQVRKVIKVTATQIVTDSFSDKPLRFRKDNGYEVTGGSRWYRGYLVGIPDEKQITAYERSVKVRAAEKVENERIQAICDAAKVKLQPILGADVKVMRWTTKEDGTKVFKIEVENMTEEQVKQIFS